MFFVMNGFSFVSNADEPETQSEYIEIRTVSDLYSIRSNMCGKYKLMNDIDLNEATSLGGDFCYKNSGWNPIGSGNAYSDIPFTVAPPSSPPCPCINNNYFFSYHV